MYLPSATPRAVQFSLAHIAMGSPDRPMTDKPIITRISPGEVISAISVQTRLDSYTQARTKTEHSFRFTLIPAFVLRQIMVRPGPTYKSKPPSQLLSNSPVILSTTSTLRKRIQVFSSQPTTEKVGFTSRPARQWIMCSAFLQYHQHGFSQAVSTLRY